MSWDSFDGIELPVEGTGMCVGVINDAGFKIQWNCRSFLGPWSADFTHRLHEVGGIRAEMIIGIGLFGQVFLEVRMPWPISGRSSLVKYDQSRPYLDISTWIYGLVFCGIVDILIICNPYFGIIMVICFTHIMNVFTSDLHRHPILGSGTTQSSRGGLGQCLGCFFG